MTKKKDKRECWNWGSTWRRKRYLIALKIPKMNLKNN